MADIKSKLKYKLSSGFIVVHPETHADQVVGLASMFSTRDSAIEEKLPLTGGTLTGGLTISGSVASGGSDYGYYQNAGTNLILKGDASGRSGIFFQSEKNGTNINHPSDYGFIQFHSYGYGGSSGESNVLAIGVANDSTDTVVLQTPYKGGVKLGFRDATSGTGLTLETVASREWVNEQDFSTSEFSENITINRIPSGNSYSIQFLTGAEFQGPEIFAQANGQELMRSYYTGSYFILDTGNFTTRVPDIAQSKITNLVDDLANRVPWSAQKSLSVGVTDWVTIATASTARALGEFVVYDDASGRHNVAQFIASTSYGKHNLTWLHGIRYGTRTIAHVRILYNTADTVYGGAKLQVYCENPTWTLRVRKKLLGSGMTGWNYWADITPVVEGTPAGWAEYTRIDDITNTTLKHVLTNDARLSDARVASDVQAWAKAETKPSYIKSEVGLGSVENYGIASQVEAEQGISAVKYMTPQRTSQAIAVQSPAGSRPASDVSAWAKKASLEAIDVPNLDADKITTGIIDIARLPALALTSTTVVATLAEAMLLYSTVDDYQEGDVIICTDENATYIHNGGTAFNSADFTKLATPLDAVSSVAGHTGAVTLTNMGLQNVTNESKATMFTNPTFTGRINIQDGVNELYKSGTRLHVRAENVDGVVQFASYGMYLPITGQTAGLYIESPIEARSGLRIGNGAANGTITHGEGSGNGFNADLLDGNHASDFASSSEFDTLNANFGNHIGASNPHGITPALIGALASGAKAVDSNLLDGIDSSSFLRSDTSDTFSGSYLDFGGAELRFQQNHFINKLFQMDAVDNNGTVYILLCANAANNDVNGTITMDRTSGLRFALKADILVSSGTGTTPVGTVYSHAIAGSGTPNIRLVTLTYLTFSYVALEIVNPDNYYETTGAYFTGRIVSTQGTPLTPVTAAQVSGVVQLQDADAFKINGSDVSLVGHTHNASAITEDASHRFITDTERTNWNAAKTHADITHAPTNAQPNQTISPGTHMNFTATSGNVTITHSGSAGSLHVPTGGATGNILQYGGFSGTAAWKANGETFEFLRGDGTWDTPPNTTYAAMSVAEGKTGTATSSRTVRADYLRQIIEHHSSPRLISVTANLTVSSTHRGKMLRVLYGDRTITLTAFSGIEIGDEIHIVNSGTGTVTIAQGSGQTINSTKGTSPTIGAQHGVVTAKYITTNIWLVFGNLA